MCQNPFSDGLKVRFLAALLYFGLLSEYAQNLAIRNNESLNV